MRIRFGIDTDKIMFAVHTLEILQDQIERGTDDLLDLLLQNGAEVANAQYGGMVNAWGFRMGGERGKIGVSGSNDDEVYIAEFGAGFAVMPIYFDNAPPIDVSPGAYSREKGSGEFEKAGRWHFGGQVYTEVEPRHGLLSARDYIYQNWKELASEVIRFD